MAIIEMLICGLNEVTRADGFWKQLGSRHRDPKLKNLGFTRGRRLDFDLGVSNHSTRSQESAQEHWCI